MNVPQILPFQKPAGILGRISGWIMARQNRVLNRIAIRELHVTESDEILEIGFGPGAAIELLLKTMPVRKVYGVEVSDVMIEQATARNQAAIDAGRLALLAGSVSDLPFEDQQFSKVFAVSTFHDWPDSARGLEEIKRVLKPKGLLILCIRLAPKFALPWSSPGLTPREIKKDLKLIESVGFCHVECSIKSRRHRIACIAAKH
jgi:ubiquinone/menaquinone biosynthesis C-methylase UbiE